MTPKKWRILVLADAISMTTGPLCSCELPLTNRDPNDFRGLPLPKTGINSTLDFACFSKNKFAVQQWVNFVWLWMASKKAKRKCFFLLRVIKFVSTKNAKGLDTGRKFIVNIEFDKVCIFNDIYLDI